MDAMSYEILVRTAYQCGRYGTPGANADIYRGMEYAYRDYTNLMAGKPLNTTLKREEIIYKAGHEAGYVAAFITDALEQTLNQYGAHLTEEERNIISGYKVELFAPTKDKIDAVIKKTWEILLSHNIRLQ